MKYILILSALFFLQVSCVEASAPVGAPLQDTITNLSLLKTRAVYKAPNGKTYHVSFEQDTEVPLPHRSGIAAKNNHAAAAANVACDHGNKFDGSYRKTAKLSIAAQFKAVGTFLYCPLLLLRFSVA